MPTAEHLTADELLHTAAVARMAGVDVATVNRWARTGRLRVAIKGPGVKGANLYRRVDVFSLLADRELEKDGRRTA